ncbi:bidirectional sugar transporter SWEET7-like [Papaver somniferum]|uniref:bidirectional sugar transporter SWEET7-like n=1 Tax=Papaver somniferum TaxID=3469 RepID=UPI000E6FB79F|nr:bidirectional sugar transporter SWEET7-like [Papaver somniferum]XP_026378374.1 bidirectional sugar transporter SWEET7-like [Papaver somniferum]XP_026378395.1 bidirectional sugar transporter SWEET7-like [Papaver somniferum]
MVNSALGREVAGIIGNLIALGLFLSPLPTFHSIYKKGEVKEYSPLPYIVTLLNCLLWVYYGKVHPNSLLVIIINAIGIVIQFSYVVFYFIYANKKQRRFVACLSLIEIAIFILVVLLCSLIPSSTKHWDIAVVTGIACDLVNIAMYVMPCLAIYKVYRTKSLEYMPFWLSLFSFVNGGFWLVYGLLPVDLYIILSNGIGCALGVIQMSVIGYYFFKYPQPKDYISLPEYPNWLKFWKSRENKIADEKAGEGGQVEISDMV